MSLIYCVEDDEGITELISCALKTGGHTVKTFQNAKELFNILNSPSKPDIILPDLVLLDLMLPGEDGFSILKRIKSSPSLEDLPVIILTAKNSEFDKVTALEDGADDYITKPFGVMELLSRVKAVLRRVKKKESLSEELSCKGLTLNLQKRTAIYNDTNISLTFKEYELLSYLIQNVNIVISRDKLMERVWGYNDVDIETRTLDMHIKTLRRKLEDSGCTDLIKTVRGVGYKIAD